MIPLAAQDAQALIHALELALKSLDGTVVLQTGAVAAVCGTIGSLLGGVGVAMWRYVQKITDREDRVKSEAQDAIRNEFKPLLEIRDLKIKSMEDVHAKELDAKDALILNEVERRERAEKEIAALRVDFTNETMPLLREVRDVVTRHGQAAIEAVHSSVEGLKENDRGNARVVEFYQAIRGLPEALARIERILEGKDDA